ncbi:MAG: translation initiation factor IF-3 [Opitutia bacterium]|jgi:translation initiation factor IF-3
MPTPYRPSGPRPNSSNQQNQRRDQRKEDKGPRRNDRIRATEVRVISAKGEMLGIMPTTKALDLAREVGVDLIEISANAQPPVCKLIEYGKYLYEEAKKHKHQKSANKVKEIKLRPRIDVHDLMIKVRRAENFLFHGHKVKLLLQYRYRELEHPEIGVDTITRAITELAHISTHDNEPKRNGRAIVVGLTPVQQNRRKLVHNAAPGEEDGEDDSGEIDGDDQE